MTGYSLRPDADADGFGPAGTTHWRPFGLVLQDRWSTWDRRPYRPRDRYAVAVHRREI